MPTVELQPVIQFVARDDSGSRSRFTFHARHGITPTAGHQAAATMRGVLAGFSGCAFERQQIEYRIEELQPAAAGPTRAARSAVFVFATTEPDQYAIIAIPAIRPELVSADGVQLDSTAPAIAGLVAELTSGAWCNPFGHQLVRLAGAIVQIRP